MHAARDFRAKSRRSRERSGKVEGAATRVAARVDDHALAENASRRGTTAPFQSRAVWCRALNQNVPERPRGHAMNSMDRSRAMPCASTTATLLAAHLVVLGFETCVAR